MKQPTSGLVAFFLGLALVIGVTIKAEVVDTVQLLQPPDPNAFQDFGYSVAISGTTAVVGAPGSAVELGAAYVYRKIGTNWFFQQKIVPPQATTNALIGISVSVDGDLLAIGAPGFETNFLTAPWGMVYMYRQTNGVWNLQARLSAPDRQRADRFGVSVALSGNSVTIGSSTHNDRGATNNGSVYVYDLTGAGWRLSAKLLPNDLTNDSSFGQSVAMSGNTFIAGANRSLVAIGNRLLTSSGAAYVFTRTNVTPFFAPWNLQQKILPNDVRNGGGFGFSVALDGDTALVGAPLSTNGGGVFAFLRTGNFWTEQTEIIPSDLTNGDAFGFSIALQGTRAVIGAVSKDSNDIPGLGAVYIFSHTNLFIGANLFAGTNLLNQTTTNTFASSNIFAATNAFGQTNLNVFAQTNLVNPTNPFSPIVFAATNRLGQPNVNVFSENNLVSQNNAFVVTNAQRAQPVFLAATNIVNVTNPVSSITNALIGTNIIVETNVPATNEGWVQQQELRPLQTASNFEFGFSVATGTQGILVGAPAAPIGRNRGAAYMFSSSEALLNIVSATAFPSILSPPNGLLVPVTITVVTTGSNVTSRIVSITSNNSGIASSRPRAGATNAIITGDLTALLRAELPENVNFDRIYDILVAATDEFGNVTTTTVEVVVPHTLGTPPLITGFNTNPVFTARAVVNASLINPGVFRPGTLTARGAITPGLITFGATNTGIATGIAATNIGIAPVNIGIAPTTGITTNAIIANNGAIVTNTGSPFTTNLATP